MIKNESKKIFFSATQSPQLIYLSQNQHMRDNSQPRLVDNNPVNFSVHRPNHRRFRSCESPLD